MILQGKDLWKFGNFLTANAEYAAVSVNNITDINLHQSF